MIRSLLLLGLLAIPTCGIVRTAQTTHAIIGAEPRDVPVVIDFFAFGTLAQEDDGIHIQPILCAITGEEVSRFVKWHEWCHYRDRGGPQWAKEDAADACAARHAPMVGVGASGAMVQRVGVGSGGGGAFALGET